jgi:S-adenosylmethionine hydrolase
MAIAPAPLYWREGTEHYMSNPVITLTTDFGYSGHFVGAMKGVILKILPDAKVIDITHDVPPFDLREAALTIAGAAPFYATGTIHVVVVDPGVGTGRRPILAEADGQFFIAPDNGVLTLIYEQAKELKVWHVTADHYFLTPVSRTFHGRDIFSTVAAWLGKTGQPADFGEPITDFVRLNLPKVERKGDTVTGMILRRDRFGNLMTDITPDHVKEIVEGNAPFRIWIGDHEIHHLVNTFSEGSPGEAVAIFGSSGYLELAVHGGDAAEMLSAGPGSKVILGIGPTPKTRDERA